MMKLNKSKFKSLEEILPLFDELKYLPGKDAIWRYRVKRKKNGKFDGVTIRYNNFSHYGKPHNWSPSKDEIVESMSSKSRLTTSTIESNYSDIVNKKFEEIYSRYLPSKLFNSYMYDNDIYSQFYSTEEELESLIRFLTLGERVEVNPIDGHISLINDVWLDYHSQECSEDDIKKEMNRRDYVNISMCNENSPELFNSKSYFNQLSSQTVLSATCWNSREVGKPEDLSFYNIFYDESTRSTYYIHHGKVKLSQIELSQIGKINVKIYDHLGNIHQYTEYHKIIYE
jgi:hypothetical protein